jgi:hypothetical protein
MVAQLAILYARRVLQHHGPCGYCWPEVVVVWVVGRAHLHRSFREFIIYTGNNCNSKTCCIAIAIYARTTGYTGISGSAALRWQDWAWTRAYPDALRGGRFKVRGMNVSGSARPPSCNDKRGWLAVESGEFGSWRVQHLATCKTPGSRRIPCGIEASCGETFASAREHGGVFDVRLWRANTGTALGGRHWTVLLCGATLPIIPRLAFVGPPLPGHDVHIRL